MATPYLIQRLKRNRTDGQLSNLRFGEIWTLDYMGNAEYEFGAFPRFLREMNAATLQDFSFNINGIKVFGVYDTSKFASKNEVENVLQNLADGKYRLKNSAMFPNTSQYNKDITGWADIENNLFWTTESMAKSIVKCIANSIVYMENEKKRKEEEKKNNA